MVKHPLVRDKIPHPFASTQSDTQEDWYEFTMSNQHGNTLRYRINVSWLLSNYRCIYGQGCPSIMLTGVNPAHGCCQIGAAVEKGERKRLDGWRKKLVTGLDTERTQEELEDWCVTKRDEDGNKVRNTKVVDGACIFANSGKNGVAAGCSLHALSLRLAGEADPEDDIDEVINHTDTKPHICWLIPNAVSYDEDMSDGVTTFTVTYHRGSWWNNDGWNTPGNPMAPGWFCTETSDAFTGNTPVYEAFEIELRKELGDAPYERMVDVLQGLQRRVSTSAEAYADGRKMIPLMVKQRVQLMVHETQLPSKKRFSERRQYGHAFRDASRDYLNTYPDQNPDNDPQDF